MELKPGYKMTEIGIIPDDWNILPLGNEIERLESGVSVNSVDEERMLYSHDESILKTSAVKDGFFLESECKKIAPNDVRRAKTNPRANTIIISRMNTPDLVGESGFVSKDYPKLFLPDRLWSTRFRARSTTDVKWLSYLLSSTENKRRIKSAATGTSGSMKNISKDALLALPIPFPNPKEQSAIAAALSDVDDLILALDQLVIKKQDIKQAVMQELLTGKKRLPGFNAKWGSKAIGDFTDCTSGGTPSTSVASYWRGAIRWMSSGELNLKIVYDVEGRITELGLKSSSAKMIPEKCVLVGLAGQGKTRGTVAMNMVPLCTNQSIAAILPNHEFASEYLYYNLDSRYDELRGLSTGDGGRGGLNLAIIKSISVPFPKVEEQAAIASVFSDMDAEIVAIESRRDKTRALKEGMMQELLTGKTRLL